MARNDFLAGREGGPAGGLVARSSVSQSRRRFRRAGSRASALKHGAARRYAKHRCPGRRPGFAEFPDAAARRRIRDGSGCSARGRLPLPRSRAAPALPSWPGAARGGPPEGAWLSLAGRCACVCARRREVGEQGRLTREENGVRRRHDGHGQFGRRRGATWRLSVPEDQDVWWGRGKGGGS